MVKSAIRQFVERKIEKLDKEMEELLVKLSVLANVIKGLRSRHAMECAGEAKALPLHEFLDMTIHIPKEQQRIRKTLGHVRARRMSWKKLCSKIAA